ncbi:MAG: T9SS type A sorting domain-containing protein [Bacteroidota bacterium]|nr:T9SS type A sorting domain-containing protein [Bacteroidia bacterium]MBP8669145.1 T9SS type A sorting domain-containing protein [Bacteroidia bacterium]QQR95287.1 MAG: T9SS type A sorting domain-containing protein [Bacteroidota bacterium]HQW18053.1 T9SS type A sorting domain-containing protein [Bacteroidia bacterium]HQX69980.1 T9SS type A sorting domain-containing protein [Bacteroidia bacterium]
MTLKSFFRLFIATLFAGLLSADHVMALYYQSVASGNWNATTTWQSSVAAGGPWAPAGATPTSADQTVTIMAGTVVRITTGITIDEVVVSPGATLIANSSANLIINNGAAVDLIINGTFVDSLGGAANINFNAGATWQISAGATIVKCTVSSCNNWQSSYQGGIASIPATANWIFRKVGLSNPSVSTTNGGTQAYYPNFIYENYTSTPFITGSYANSHFNGSASYTIIKGSMDIGGSGTNYVNFTSNNINPTIGVQVRGDVIIRPGNTYNNIGTGTEVWGDVYMDGTWKYYNGNGRRLVFSGNANSTVWGSGHFQIHELTMAKILPASITLNRSLMVDSLVNFNSGKIYSSATNPLIFNVGAKANTVSNNNSFVEGPVRKLGSTAFVFPVGMANDVQPAGLSASGAPSDSGLFWTENFNNGCTSLCDANGYSGFNGAWSVMNSGTNGNRANMFYVSCSEANRPVNTCAGGCATGGDATLHVGTSPCATCLICPTGDCGAIYDTLASGGFDPTTDKRAVSPPINTVGKSNMSISFKYINVGDLRSPASSTDKALLEYSVDNGLTWTALINIPRSSTVGGCALYKRWTAFGPLNLPAACNDLPNLLIGFRWINNNNSIGATINTNGSFAVDEVNISGKSAESFTTEYFHINPTVIYNNVVNPPLDHVSRMEYWYMTKEIGDKRKITLYWDGNSGGVTSLPDLRVARFNGASWDDLGNTGTTGTAAAGTITSDSTKDYGPVTLASVIALPGNPLPVELLSFNGNRHNDEIKLNWLTSSELNNHYFTLKRSGNNLQYTELGKVNGAGTTNLPQRYDYIDSKPLRGINYYKLFQTDFDGTTEEKATLAIRFDAYDGDVLVLPDFNHEQVLLQFSENNKEPVNIMLMDAAGRLMLQTVCSESNTCRLLTSHLSRGVYVLRMQTADGVIVKRFFY